MSGMAFIGARTHPEGFQKRWLLGAIGIALLVHVGVAGALGLFKLHGLEVPFSHSGATGPFTVKRIEINPDALHAHQDDPTAKLPSAEAPQNPSQFNLDPSAVERALRMPQPALATPAVPEPNRVIAAMDLSHGLPFAESDTAQVSAEIAKVDPVSSGNPVTSSKLAEDIISSTGAPANASTTGGTGTPGAGSAGKLPGFAELAPGFKTPPPNLANLPEPILLRLPSDVLFDFDSATLKPEADGLLSQAIVLVTKYAEADVRVDGYSDSFGKPDYNVSLSQKRAQAVQAWLQQRIAQPGYRFDSRGHGSADYVVSAQGTIEQQQPNRRVEILIQATKP